MAFDLEDYKRAVRNLRGRKPHKHYPDRVFNLSMEQFLHHILTRRDKIDGMLTGTVEIYLIRKRDKYWL